MLVQRHVKGKKIFKIYREDSPRYPRKDSNLLGTLVGYHPHLNIVDVDLKKPATDETLKQFLADFDEPPVYLPVYLLNHSGMRVSTKSFDDPWDSGKLGIIYLTQSELIAQELSVEQALAHLQTEIDVLDYYVSYEVYGFESYTKKTCSECGAVNKETQSSDSCWGFLGSDHEKSGLLESANVILDEWTEENQ